jgi:hypothetical protein
VAEWKKSELSATSLYQIFLDWDFLFFLPDHPQIFAITATAFLVRHPCIHDRDPYWKFKFDLLGMKQAYILTNTS